MFRCFIWFLQGWNIHSTYNYRNIYQNFPYCSNLYNIKCYLIIFFLLITVARLLYILSLDFREKQRRKQSLFYQNRESILLSTAVTGLGNGLFVVFRFMDHCHKRHRRTHGLIWTVRFNLNGSNLANRRWNFIFYFVGPPAIDSW
jgi:hypothetical protein